MIAGVFTPIINRFYNIGVVVNLFSTCHRFLCLFSVYTRVKNSFSQRYVAEKKTLTLLLNKVPIVTFDISGQSRLKLNQKEDSLKILFILISQNMSIKYDFLVLLLNQ